MNSVGDLRQGLSDINLTFSYRIDISMLVLSLDKHVIFQSILDSYRFVEVYNEISWNGKTEVYFDDKLHFLSRWKTTKIAFFWKINSVFRKLHFLCQKNMKNNHKVSASRTVDSDIFCFNRVIFSNQIYVVIIWTETLLEYSSPQSKSPVKHLR